MNVQRPEIVIALLCIICNYVAHAGDRLPKVEEIEQPLCWMKEEYTALGEECRPCKSIDYKLFSAACMQTGYREKVKCLESGADVYKSCPKPSWLEEKVFWAFEGVMLLCAVCACTMVYVRRKKMERDMMERVKKQISAAV